MAHWGILNNRPHQIFDFLTHSLSTQHSVLRILTRCFFLSPPWWYIYPRKILNCSAANLSCRRTTEEKKKVYALISLGKASTLARPRPPLSSLLSSTSGNLSRSRKSNPELLVSFRLDRGSRVSFLILVFISAASLSLSHMLSLGPLFKAGSTIPLPITTPPISELRTLYILAA